MRALPLLALALLATSLAPGAGAQGAPCTAMAALCQTTVQLTIAPSSEPVPPDGMLALPVTIAYSYSPLALTFAPTPITLTVTQAPPWLQASLSPSTLYAEVQPVGSSLSQQMSPPMNAFLLLALAGDAPAFEQGIVEIVAEAAPNGNLAASTAATQLPVQAGYVGLVELSTPAPALALAPRDGGLVPLRVENLGNAATRVTFEVIDAPDGIVVTLPGDLTLASGFESERTGKTVAFGIEAPGSYLPGEVVLEARPAYALNQDIAGPPARLTVHVAPPGQAQDGTVQTLGAGRAQPLEPLTFGLLAAGAAGVALLERHRRRKA